jgi:hypothetical protein
MRMAKRNTTQKKSDRRKANAAREEDEHVLSTIDGASGRIEIGSLIPSKSDSSGGRHLFRVTRTNEELDVVFGVIIERCPMPWWKWNNFRREGLVTDEMLEEFNATTHN